MWEYVNNNNSSTNSVGTLDNTSKGGISTTGWEIQNIGHQLYLEFQAGQTQLGLTCSHINLDFHPWEIRAPVTQRNALGIPHKYQPLLNPWKGFSPSPQLISIV